MRSMYCFLILAQLSLVVNERTNIFQSLHIIRHLSSKSAPFKISTYLPSFFFTISRCLSKNSRIFHHFFTISRHLSKYLHIFHHFFSQRMWFSFPIYITDISYFVVYSIKMIDSSDYTIEYRVHVASFFIASEQTKKNDGKYVNFLKGTDLL